MCPTRITSHASSGEYEWQSQLTIEQRMLFAVRHAAARVRPKRASFPSHKYILRVGEPSSGNFQTNNLTPHPSQSRYFISSTRATLSVISEIPSISKILTLGDHPPGLLAHVRYLRTCNIVQCFAGTYCTFLQYLGYVSQSDAYI